MNKDKVSAFILLHILLFVYSAGGIISKLAANEEFLSFQFLLYYSGVLIILFAYALLWQQILKKLPLIMAYANKAVTVIWGIVWGAVFFQEPVTLNKLIGSVIIIGGVYLVVSEGESAK